MGVRVGGEADGLVFRDADDDLEEVRVGQAVALDADEVEGLLVAQAEGDVDAFLLPRDCERLAQPVARGDARRLLVLSRLSRPGRGGGVERGGEREGERAE